MLAYTVWLKGRKDPIRFDLADDTLLKQYHEYLGTGTNPIGSYIAEDERKGVVPFTEVQMMHTDAVPQVGYGEIA